MINSGFTDQAGNKQSAAADWANYGGAQQTLAARSSIPEDSARRLFDTLYDALIYATPEDRRKAVLMLVAAYDLLV